MDSSGRSVVSNFIWRFMERMGAQIVGLIVSIILARLLSPTDYGTVGLINVFLNILTVFVNGGFASALIQKKNADDTDFSSVFYAQLFVCLVLFLVTFFCAPFIAEFYERPFLTPMIRVLSITLIVSGVKNVQTAYVSRNLIFRKFFFATLGGTIGAAFLGIFLAYKGYGAWALIGQSLFNNIVDTIILWITVKWRPKKVFSFNRLKSLFSYGWKLLVSSLLDNGYNNLRSLVIGKVYSSEDLAYYDKGKSWPYLVITNINASIDSVLLPSMSIAQDDKCKVKAMTRRAIKTSTFVMSPLLMGLAACGEPLIRFVLTEKWLPAVPFQVVFCITYMFYPINTANLNAINAMGRSDLFLKLELIKKAFGIILLIISVRISVMAIVYSLLVSSLFGQIVNSWPNRKLMNYGFIEQMKDILPGVLLAVFMGFCVYWIKYLPISDFSILVLQIIGGVIIYVGGALLFRIESFFYLLSMLKGFLGKKAK